MHVADDWCLLLDIILAKEAKGALIREKLWHKSVSDDNIYDGRDKYEVMKLLYIEDTREMLRRYAGQLTKGEVRLLQQRCIDNSYQLLKLSSIIRMHYMQSFGKLVSAFWLNPVLFVQVGLQKARK